MRMLWRGLPVVLASTRRRVLAECLQVCQERGALLPKPAHEALLKELLPDGPSRNRVRNVQGLQAAARHFVRNPNCSLGDLAVAAGMSRGSKTTVRAFLRYKEFEDACLAEAVRIADERGGPARHLLEEVKARLRTVR
jgi:hypothetical protein